MLNFSPSQIQEQQKRLRRIDDVCRLHNISRSIPPSLLQKYTSHFIVDDQYQILFTFIPKVSCTSWKGVFRRLYKSHKVGQFTALQKYPKQDIELRLNTYFKAVFVREPITRLLSAYLSKFHGPPKLQRIWEKMYGRKIVKQYRSTEDDTNRQYPNDPWLNITFEEFARYITDNGDAIKLNQITDHFLPMYKVAFPCAIPYDFIGHFEELNTEASDMLQFLGIDHVVEYPEVHESRSENCLSEELQQVPLRIIRQLREYYSLDYHLFGYSFNDTFLNKIL